MPLPHALWPRRAQVAGIEPLEGEEEEEYVDPGMDGPPSQGLPGTQQGGATPIGPTPASGGALSQPPPAPPVRPNMLNRPLVPGPFGLPMYARGPSTLMQPYPMYRPPGLGTMMMPGICSTGAGR